MNTRPPAGPELDALVAERVMGWTHKLRWKNDREGAWWAPDENVTASPHPGWRLKYDAYSQHQDFCFDCGVATDEPWSPSTRMQDAWQVVERMSTTTKEYWTIRYFSTGAFVNFDYEGGRNLPWTPGEYEADADELPHAICLAALEAVADE